MTNNKFNGVFPALLTPFDSKNKINENALGDLINLNIKKGVSGFYVCGSTAEVFLLSESERRSLMKSVKEIVNNRVTLIAHVGSVSTDEAVSLAHYADELGFDAVSAVAPFYYKFTLNEIKNYYYDIAKCVKIPMIIYNIPAFSGVTLSTENISCFLDDPHFMGVKHTSNDFFMLERIKATYPDKIIYNGYDEMFLSGLIAGADGGIGSTYNFMAEKFISMQSLYNDNKIDQAREIQHDVNFIIENLIKVGVMAGEKAMLNLMGFDFGCCRKPYSECTKSDIEFLEKNVMPLLI